jgi:endonuclease/exonuclease/phosphatase family metal-dependent hydrolase
MRVRIATLNAWAIPEPIGRDVSVRIDAIGRRLASLHLDAIAFQEVWTSDAARRMIDAGREAGLPHSWFEEDRFGAGVLGGLLVLSRFPVQDVSFERFALRGEPKRVASNLEYVSGKGFASIHLETPAGALVVVNTHLHARYTRYASHKHVPHRTSQAIQVASRFIDRPEPMVAVGDFNFREGEADYRVLTDILGLRDVAALLENRQNTTLRSSPYRKPTGFDKRKDYIFSRSGEDVALLPRKIERSFDERLEFDGRAGGYSNHAGLVATFDLVPARTAVRPEPASWVFDVVEHALQEGESLAMASQTGDRQTGIGLGLAAVAMIGATPKRMNRRRMLRGFLAGGAVLALTPGVGLGIVSEVLLPDEIEAYRLAASQLAQLRDPGRLARSEADDSSA